MRKYDLILCYEALSRYLIQPNAWEKDYEVRSQITNIINQHNIVWSERLDEEYKNKYANNVALLDAYLGFVSAQFVTTGGLLKSYGDVASVDTHDELLISLSEEKSIPAPCIVCAECIEKNNIKKNANPKRVAYYSSLLDKSIDNLIGRVSASSPEFHFDVKEGEPLNAYSEWISELFREEQSVIIIDSYILQYRNWNVLEKVYLDSTEQGCCVKIYTKKNWTSTDNAIKQWLKRIEKRRGIRIQVFTSATPKPSEHDRSIFFGSTRLRIGLGLDFLDLKNKHVRGNTSIDLESVNQVNQIINELNTTYQEFHIHV